VDLPDPGSPTARIIRRRVFCFMAAT